VIFNHAKVISIDWLSYTIFDITRCPSSRSLHVHLATCTRRGIENYRQRAGVPMAQRNEIHAGSITGSVVVAGSGNTINARLRVELAKEPPPSAEAVDIRAEFDELRKILEQLQTPDQGKIRRALDDASEELAKPEADKKEVGGALKRALDYAGKVASLGDEAVKLAPHVHKLADWLGSEWTSLLS
jgi:hypothetical protein